MRKGYAPENGGLLRTAYLPTSDKREEGSGARRLVVGNLIKAKIILYIIFYCFSKFSPWT